MAGGDNQLEQFVLLAKGTRGHATSDLIVKATEHPGVFVFGELLDVPSVQELRNTEQAAVFSLLELFAYGSLPDYHGACQHLGQLSDAQTNKLRQLTVVKLAGQLNMIPYAILMEQIGLSSIRELEDFLIGECIYAGIVKGKLDQHKHCLHVDDAISRDVRREDLSMIMDRLQEWHGQTASTMTVMEERARWTQAETANADRLQAAMDARMEESRKGMKLEAATPELGMGNLDSEPLVADLMEHERSTGVRPKRRR